MNEVWYLVDHNNFVFNTFDTYTEAVAEYKRYYSKIEKEAALDWMLKHPENKSSILSSITSARQNAKMVRHALTTDVWEAINGSFLDIQNLLKTKIRERAVS